MYTSPKAERFFSLAASRFKTLTKKPTVRWSLEEGVVAKDFSEITVGLQLVGWIKNIMSYGVFVEFPYGLVGLAPKSVSEGLHVITTKSQIASLFSILKPSFFIFFKAMSDKFISDTTAAFQLGQTVLAKVTNLDEEKRRFLVTLKISEVISAESNVQTRLINGLQERRAVSEMLAMRGVCVCSSESLGAYS